MRRILCGVLSLVALLMGGCIQSSRFAVHVDAIGGHDPAVGRTYVLTPGNENTPPGDLQFNEFAKYVNRALSAKGYTETTEPNKADLVIFLAYGVGDPEEHQYAYNTPVWGQTGVLSANTFGTINQHGSQSTFSSTTTYTPTYGVVGYMAHTGTYITHFRFMILNAYDLKKSIASQKLVQMWRTVVTSTGQSGDLRLTFPILVAATKDYMGSSTGRSIDMVLNEDDPAVMEIRGLVQAAPASTPANGKSNDSRRNTPRW